MYQLSSSFVAHTADVLGLDVTADDCIVSCSRDKTSKLWKLNGNHNKFFEAESYISEHKLACKFQTCVCVLSPTDLFEWGLVLTGDNDNRILVYEPNNTIAIRQLRAHTNAVSRITKSTEPNVFLSASWDTTVKMWLITDEGIECILTFDCHSVSVWAVLQIKQKYILTGSADKLIRIFNVDGTLIKTLIGHEDCVRDLVEINDDEILSCSNDTTVRRWSVNSGKCLEVLHGHPNYVYSVRILGSLIVSCGEDGCLLLWSHGKLVQTITLPTRSVWAIGVMSNNDIVTGTSDGIIRIFTTDRDRLADEKVLRDFVKECRNFPVPFKKSLGRAKVSRFHGPEILSKPGIKEGQTILIRESEKVNCYSWSFTEKTWRNVGHIDAEIAPVDHLKSDLTEKRKLVLKERKEKFSCAVCRRSFVRKYSLRKHFKETDHTVAPETHNFLMSVIPDIRPYHVTNFKRKGSCFRLEVCLSNMNSHSDLQMWVRTFAELNKCVYNRNSVKRCPRGGFNYSEFYRCQNSHVSKSESRKQRTKATGCKSTIHGILRHDSIDNSCYGKININFVHNHSTDYNQLKKPTPAVKDIFCRMYRDGLTPGNALRAYKKHLELESPETFQALLLDRSVCPDYSWVRHFFRKLQKNAEPRNETVGESCRVDESTTYVDRNERLEMAVVEENILELRQSDIMNIDEMIKEEEIGDEDETHPNIIEALVDEFSIFIRKLKEEPRYYESGIVSMCRELQNVCQSTAESRLHALYSFNKDIDASEI